MHFWIFQKKNLAYSFFSTSTQLDGSKSITTSWFHAYLRSQISEGSGTQNLGCFVFRKWQVKPGFFWCTYLIIFRKHYKIIKNSQKGKKYPKIRFGVQNLSSLFDFQCMTLLFGTVLEDKQSPDYPMHQTQRNSDTYICIYCWQRHFHYLGFIPKS